MFAQLADQRTRIGCGSIHKGTLGVRPRRARPGAVMAPAPEVYAEDRLALQVSHSLGAPSIPIHREGLGFSAMSRSAAA